MSKKNVLIIGAGVSGLTVAKRLLDNGHDVEIWSLEEPGQFPRTSVNAWATWWPLKLDADSRIEKWSDESLPVFTALADDSESGVAMRRIFSLQHKLEKPWYDGKYDFFRYAEKDEIGKQYEGAFVMDEAPVIDTDKYLAWLYKQLVAAGARFVQKKVESLDEVPESRFQAIVNCTALGARKLVGDDTVFPARLQVLRIRHNGLDKAYFDDQGPTAIVPHSDHIRIGSAYDEGSESLEVDEELTAGILQRCRDMVPGFQVSEEDIISTTRVLRPERKGWVIRVEKETLPGNRLLIHNYGHDGMGYGTSWGIANEVAGYLAD